MASGWTCTIVNLGGDVELEQLDDAGEDWFAEGPGGDAIGGLDEVLAAVIDDHADPAWITVVRDTLKRELGSVRRSMLLAKRVTGRWFHTTFARIAHRYSATAWTTGG